MHNLKRAAANHGAGSDYRPSAFDVNKQLLLRLLSSNYIDLFPPLLVKYVVPFDRQGESAVGGVTL